MKGEGTGGNPEGPVLVPIDFSEHSEAALRWAVCQAVQTQAPLLIVHVVHDPESGPGYYVRPKRKGFLRRMQEAADEMMSEFMERFRSANAEIEDVDTEIELVVGLPATRILELADRHHARHIVMGSQGRTGLARFLMGSKALRVAHLAPMPVTIVKGDGH